MSELLRHKCLTCIAVALLVKIVLCDNSSGGIRTSDDQANQTINNENRQLQNETNNKVTLSPIRNHDRRQYQYLEYEQLPNNGTDVLYPDPALLFENPNAVDILPEVDLPGNDLTDIDLKGRDTIDNIMYIYYGTNVNAKGGFGVQIVIVGCVISLAAQFLTVIFLYLKNRRLKKLNLLFPVVINMATCLCVANLIFIIGVQATRSPLRCEMTALLLHYAHLVCSAWIFVYCYVISDHVISDCVPNIRYNCLLAYGVPAVFVLFSYAVTPDSYESKNYCWMSVQKGMFLNYMLPVTLLIVVNTIFATFALKSVNQKIQNLLTISIESFLDSRFGSSFSVLQRNGFDDKCNTNAIVENRMKEMSDLNLDEELIFEACEIKTEIHLKKNKYDNDPRKYGMSSSVDFDNETYKKTLQDLEKPKTSDYRNPNIYVDIENAKYNVDNPNVFYDVDNVKTFEFENRTSFNPQSYEIENVNIFDNTTNTNNNANSKTFDAKPDTELAKHYDHAPNYDHCKLSDKLDLANISLGDFSLQSSDFPDLSDFKKCIRFAIFLQPAFDVCWFLGVVGVENSSTTVMPVVFIVCYNVLNWIILARTSTMCPLVNPCPPGDSDSQDGGHGPNVAGGSDDIPLLNTHSQTCTVGVSCLSSYHNQGDAISTISN